MSLDDFVSALPASNLFELLERTEAAHFDVDRRHVAVRSGKEWLVYQRLPDGWLKQIRRWTGPRRSIFEHLDELGIDISRTAEEAIGEMAETTGFRSDDAPIT